ncbi:hypothetical protein GGS26DRAFT_546288 [Hypomontagnella submonticulosa]|nr:hypothetical protein GGS26DRAFT_546288 [Hypomontagnella submonticulosa]
MRSNLSYRAVWRQHFSPASHNGSILCYPELRRPFSHFPSNSNSNANRPLIFPEGPGSSSEHHDLASYAAYAERTGLDIESKTYVGTRYEYAVAEALSRLGFSLKRIGGRSDAGIDLLGTWRVPSSSTETPLRVLLQCKASSSQSTKIGPHHVRELEGAFVGAPPGWRISRPGSGVLGFLVAQRPATKGMRDALGRSRWPMGYVSCTQDGRLEQMLWNGRAEEEGLEGLGVGVRFCEDAAGGRTEQRLVLTWNGKPYEFDKELVDESV